MPSPPRAPILTQGSDGPPRGWPRSQGWLRVAVDIHNQLVADILMGMAPTPAHIHHTSRSRPCSVILAPRPLLRTAHAHPPHHPDRESPPPAHTKGLFSLPALAPPFDPHATLSFFPPERGQAQFRGPAGGGGAADDARGGVDHHARQRAGDPAGRKHLCPRRIPPELGAPLRWM